MFNVMNRPKHREVYKAADRLFYQTSDFQNSFFLKINMFFLSCWQKQLRSDASHFFIISVGSCTQDSVTISWWFLFYLLLLQSVYQTWCWSINVWLLLNRWIEMYSRANVLSTCVTASPWKMGENAHVHRIVMYPSLPIGAGADKYLWLLHSHFSREWKLTIPIPNEDKIQMLVGVRGISLSSVKEWVQMTHSPADGFTAIPLNLLLSCTKTCSNALYNVLGIQYIQHVFLFSSEYKHKLHSSFHVVSLIFQLKVSENLEYQTNKLIFNLGGGDPQDGWELISKGHQMAGN